MWQSVLGQLVFHKDHVARKRADDVVSSPLESMIVYCSPAQSEARYCNCTRSNFPFHPLHDLAVKLAHAKWRRGGGEFLRFCKREDKWWQRWCRKVHVVQLDAWWYVPCCWLEQRSMHWLVDFKCAVLAHSGASLFYQRRVLLLLSFWPVAHHSLLTGNYVYIFFE